MAVVPTLPDFSGGGTAPTTQLNLLSSAISFLLNPPRMRCRQTVAQTLTSSVWASLLFDINVMDANVGGFAQHSTSVSTSIFSPQYPGTYLCSGGFGIASMATPAGRRGVRWVVNGTTVRASAQEFQSSSTTVGAYAARPILIALGNSDQLELQGFFEGGGTVATAVTDHNDCSMDVLWVAST